MLFRIALFLLTVSSVSSSWAAPYKPRQGDLSAQICVERPENNGMVNLVASHIVFSNNQELALVGGQAACIFVADGVYSFVVQSPDPYKPGATNPKAWTSKEIKARLKRGEVVVFEVIPKSEGAAYIGGWIVKTIVNSKQKRRRIHDSTYSLRATWVWLGDAKLNAALR
jgi:hypothetical protein